MWLYMIAAFLILVGIIGGVFSGGIFTIVFIPLGVIMVVAAVLFGMWGRASRAGAGAETRGGSETRASEPAPLRHTPASAPAAPSTPEDLVDARRAQQ